MYQLPTRDIIIMCCEHVTVKIKSDGMNMFEERGVVENRWYSVFNCNKFFNLNIYHIFGSHL